MILINTKSSPIGILCRSFGGSFNDVFFYSPGPIEVGISPGNFMTLSGSTTIGKFHKGCVYVITQIQKYSYSKYPEKKYLRVFFFSPKGQHLYINTVLIANEIHVSMPGKIL